MALQIVRRAALHAHAFTSRRSSTLSTTTRQFKVVLDGETLYVEKSLAEALGWNPQTSAHGVSLRLSGWDPDFFTITSVNTDADLHAQTTIECAQNPTVQYGLEYLKAADAQI